MIFRYINIITLALSAMLTISCSSSSSSSTPAGTVTTVSMNAAPSPATAAVMMPGAKTFTNTEGHSITLNKAYLVISSTTIETTCGASFSAALEGVLDLVIPVANAHTTTTPTSTGAPHVIDILAMDNAAVSIGSVSPAVADYCGVDIDMFAADADTSNLPSAPDMVGKTLYIEASYAESGGANGTFVIDTGISLVNRELLLSALVMISSSNPSASLTLGVNYDTWFDTVDLQLLETETATSTDPNDLEVSKLLQNITDSIHQI